MAVKYCGGNPSWPKPCLVGDARPCAWLGGATNRLICLGAQSAFSGRKRWEDQFQQAAAALRQLADAHAQQEPDVSHERHLHTADGPSGIAGAQRAGV